MKYEPGIESATENTARDAGKERFLFGMKFRLDPSDGGSIITNRTQLAKVCTNQQKCNLFNMPSSVSLGHTYASDAISSSGP